MSYYRQISLCAVCCLLLLSSFRYGNELYGETVITKRGDEVTFSKPKEREVIVGNKVKTTLVTEKPKPILLNGKRIYHYKDDNIDQWKGTEADINTVEEYQLLTNMIDSAIAPEILHLPAGYYQYELMNMVVDERGYIAYYETKGIVQSYPSSNPFAKPLTKAINPASTYIINGIITRQINRMRYTPLIINGEPTAYLSRFGYSYRHKG